MKNGCDVEFRVPGKAALLQIVGAGGSRAVTTLAVAAVVAAGAVSAAADTNVVRNGVTWDATFEGGNQPHFDQGPGPVENPAWTFGGASGSAGGSSDGTAYIHNSTPAGYYYFDQTDGTWTNAGTARTLEFRARVVGQTAPDDAARLTIGINDDFWEFKLNTNGVQLGSFIPLGSVTPVDTSVFHTYRIVFDASLPTDKAKVYIDGDGTPAISTGAAAPNTIADFDLLRFTDGSTGGIGGTSEWDFISWTAGAHPAGPFEVSFATVEVTNVFAMDVASNADLFYNLEYTMDIVPPTNWVDTGTTVFGAGGAVLLFDPTGFSTQKIYRVIATPEP